MKHSSIWKKSFHGLGPLLAALTVLALAGCANAPKITDYTQEQPPLVLSDYLKGHLKAEGLFKDRAGAVVRRFTVDMKGTWSGQEGQEGQEEGTLDEHFVYQDHAHQGDLQQRIWHLKRIPSEPGVTRFEGRADDVVGVAQGELAGNTLHWHYRLNLPVDGRLIEVDMDDWMYLMTPKLMLNHAVMSKWGVKLGEVQIVFDKLAD